MVLVLLLCGCGTVTPLPQDVFLRLDVTAPTKTVAKPWTTGALRVAPLVASGLHKERQLAYTRDQGNSLQQSHHQLWVDSPEKLLQYEVARYLRQARVATEVGTDYAARAALVVSGRVLRFEQVIDRAASGMSATVELALRHGKADEWVLAKEYAAFEPLAESTPTAAAQAMSRALATICAAFVADVDAALSDLPPARTRSP